MRPWFDRAGSYCNRASTHLASELRIRLISKAHIPRRKKRRPGLLQNSKRENPPFAEWGDLRDNLHFFVAKRRGCEVLEETQGREAPGAARKGEKPRGDAGTKSSRCGGRVRGVWVGGGKRKAPRRGACEFMVPGVGLEPTHLAVSVFETDASAIPPPGRVTKHYKPTC